MYSINKPVTIINNRFRTYLIGAMENPADGDSGIGWRQAITPKLNDLGVFCFDPTKEESRKFGLTTPELVENLNMYQKTDQWEKFKTTMKKIWRGTPLIETDADGETRSCHLMGDVDYVERSDFLIFNMKEGDKLGGSIAELAIAWYTHTPVYLVTKIPLTEINKSILYFVLDSCREGGIIVNNQNDLIEILSNRYNLTNRII